MIDVEPTLLVVGFGAFSTVVDNPASRLACALDGRLLGTRRVIGREIPVRYDEGPAETLRLIERYRPLAVLGIGVAVGRAGPMLERLGVRHANPSLEDSAGLRVADLEPEGPEVVHSTAAVQEMAAAMGVQLSEDAGRYVCNAWLYRVVRAVGSVMPVAFLHVPEGGMPEEQLAQALIAVWGR